MMFKISFFFFKESESKAAQLSHVSTQAKAGVQSGPKFVQRATTWPSVSYSFLATLTYYNYDEAFSHKPKIVKKI